MTIGRDICVLHVLPSDSLGGKERIALTLALEQALLGIRSNGVVLRRGEGSLGASVAAASGVNYLHPPHRLFRVSAMRRVLANIRPDILQCHDGGLKYVLLACLFLQNPPVIVCTVHAPLDRSAMRPERLLTRGVATKFTGATVYFVGVSSSVADTIRGWKWLSHAQISSVQNGVRPMRRSERWARLVRQILKVPVQSPLLLSVGNLRLEKRYSILLRAVAKLKREGVCVTLVIVGSGSERDRLILLARELNILSQVRIVGVRNSFNALASAADGFVSVSAYEGFGLAIAEALAAGMPIFSTTGAIEGVCAMPGRCGRCVANQSPSPRAFDPDCSDCGDVIAAGLRNWLDAGPPPSTSVNLVTERSMAAAYLCLYRYCLASP